MAYTREASKTNHENIESEINYSALRNSKPEAPEDYIEDEVYDEPKTAEIRRFKSSESFTFSL